MDESISSDSTRLPQQGDPLQSSDSVGLKDVSAWVEEYQARRDRSSQNSQTSRPRPTYYAPTTMTETFDNVDSVNRANSVYSTDSMDIDDSVYSTDSMDIDDSVHSGDSGDSVNSTPMLTPESALNNLLGESFHFSSEMPTYLVILVFGVYKRVTKRRALIDR
ncbi:hypothetical protein BKA56DRAFT_88488 [Ilyonectria sp. MPI-CAGE-AT-0026]|nr:hypothetical protein BKA56DRAFT_88488 [Ilyonectria sp. MPI-CAGE-AT-0026]